MSSWTAASSDCSRPVNNYVHVKTADLYRPNARLTPERQGYQVLTPFGKLGYSHVYHVACGLVVLASTVENRVYLPFGGERIYPNLWHLILGPSSFYRTEQLLQEEHDRVEGEADHRAGPRA